MKNRSTVLIWLLTACLLLCLSGCEQETAPTEESITSSVYNLSQIDAGMLHYNTDTFQITGTIELRSDGTATLDYGGQVSELQYENGRMWVAGKEEDGFSYTLVSGILTLDYYSEVLTFLIQ